MNKFISNNLAVERIKQWVAEVNHWQIISLAILLMVFDYCLLIKPSFQQYSRLQGEEIKLKLEFEEKQQNAATLHDRRKQLMDLNKRYNNLLKQFSTPRGISSLLDEISKVGAANGLIFEFFAPLPEVPMDFYVELPIKMTIQGRYEQLALFLNQIAQWDQIVTIDSFELLPAADEKQVSAEILVMKIIAKIYRSL